MGETIPEGIRKAMEACPAFLDYPTAWAIQKDRGERLTHHPRCSSVPGWDAMSGAWLLCDCGAVEQEWQRLRALAQPKADAAEGVATRQALGASDNG